MPAPLLFGHAGDSTLRGLLHRSEHGPSRGRVGDARNTGQPEERIDVGSREARFVGNGCRRHALRDRPAVERRIEVAPRGRVRCSEKLREQRKEQMSRVLIVRPAEAWTVRQQLRRRNEVVREHVEQCPLSRCLLGARFERFTDSLAERGLGTRGAEPAAKARHTRARAPRSLEVRGEVPPFEALRCERRTVEELSARVVLVGDELGCLAERLQRGLPILRLDEAPAPRAKVLGSLRRARYLRQPLRSLEPLHDLAKPAVLFRVPVVGALADRLARDQLAPPRKERSKVGERLNGDALHFAQRLPEEPDAPHFVDGRPNGLSAVRDQSEHVARHHVLRRALGDVGAEDLVDQLVLSQVDVALGDGRKQRAEDAVRGRVVLAEKRR